MRTKESTLVLGTGMDRSPEAPIQSFYLLENCIYDPGVKAWCTGLGLESYFKQLGSSPVSLADTLPIRSLYEWNVQGTTILVYEQGDQLVWQARGLKRVLDQGRPITQQGSTYIPIGDWLIILNGDRPIKVDRRGRTSSFSFSSLPASPSIYNVDTSRMVQTDTATSATDSGIAIYPQFHLDTTAWGILEYDLGAGAISYLGPKDTAYHGLGTTQVNDTNYYGYKVAFISESGAISGLSPAVYCRWDILEPLDNEANEALPNPYGVKYGVQLDDLPDGPDNTVARYIYRTRNMRDGIIGAGEEYFLAAIIQDNATTSYVDFRPDNELVSRAPTTLEAWVIPQDASQGVLWDNRLWLAGSSSNPQRLYYSEPNQPEQFGLNNFFDVSTRQAGNITGLSSFQNMLIITREYGTEVVTRAQDRYQLSILHPSIGSESPSGVVETPLGVMFFNEQGIYLASGNLQGGSTPGLQEVSTPISQIFTRVNPEALTSVQAAYSRKYKEVWFHIPIDGSDVPNLGLVFHLDTLGWSIRGILEDELNPYWEFLSLATDTKGHYLIGPNSRAIGDNWGLLGVQTLSMSGTMMIPSDVTLGENVLTVGSIEPAPIFSTLMSQWTPIATNKIQYLGIELSLYEISNTPLPLGTMVDRNYHWDQEIRLGQGGTQITPLHPDNRDTKEATPMYGVNPRLMPLAVYDESRLSDARPIVVRADVNPNIRDCALWYTRTREPNQIIGWAWKLNNTAITQRR